MSVLYIVVIVLVLLINTHKCVLLLAQYMYNQLDTLPTFLFIYILSLYMHVIYIQLIMQFLANMQHTSRRTCTSAHYSNSCACVV